MPSDRFWEYKPLAEMTHGEWEALCDGCGKCCLVKLQEEDDGPVEYTDVACRLLDLGTCRCSEYANRKSHVPDCVQLSPAKLADLDWMPSTCAYRLLADGHPLPAWHPLVSGDPNSVHAAGMSVSGRVVSERQVKDSDLEDHIVDWPR